MQNSKLYIGAVFVLAGLLPFVAVADSVSVSNTVTTSANSGGNTNSGGHVVEGKSTNSVSVKTVVNGKVVEDYSETSEKPITYTSTVNGSTSVKVSGSAKTNTDTKAYAARKDASETSTQDEVTSPMVGGLGESSVGDSSDAAAAANLPVEASAMTEVDADASIAVRVVAAVQSFIYRVIGIFSWW